MWIVKAILLAVSLSLVLVVHCHIHIILAVVHMVLLMCSVVYRLGHIQLG